VEPWLIAAAAMKWMAAAWWSGLRLLLVPDLRRRSPGRTTKSAVEFFAADRSFKIKQANRNYHKKKLDSMITTS